MGIALKYNCSMTQSTGFTLLDSLRLYNKEIKPPPLCSKKTESLWGVRWGVGGCVLLPTKICSRVCIGSFCKFTAVSLHGFRKSAKEMQKVQKMKESAKSSLVLT